MFSMVCAAAASAQGPEFLYLDLQAYGEKTYITWKANEGLPDLTGGQNFALEMEKNTSADTIAYAYVLGVWRRPVTFLTQGTGLSWERRAGTYCRYPPSFVVRIIGKSGAVHWLLLRCFWAVQSAGSREGWVKETFSPSQITAQIISQNGADPEDALAGTIDVLALAFNAPMAEVLLDNIRVNNKVWSYPADNGRVTGGKK